MSARAPRLALAALAVAMTLAALSIPAPARAQSGAHEDARLDARLAPETRGAVLAIVDSARAEGLPGDPLVLKALEGASKGAAGPRIVAAVRALRGRLREVRDALGPSAAPEELVAGESALRAGATRDELTRLRAARPGESLTVPLAVLSDLIARGVPADTASSIIRDLARRGAGDDGFFALRTDVERDIMAGAAPLGAATARAREIPVRPAPPRVPPPEE
ncbi:MAG TPA: hypothetical protein VFS05_06585 [Gemmatimonadaceae bacterium]|nr:hypothetical protein [Gemmatimonadaceae bacterium]